MLSALMLVAVLSSAAPIQGNSNVKGSEPMELVRVLFSQDLRDGALTASFPRNSTAFVSLTGNYEARQEIGDYEVDLGSQAFDSLHTLIQQVSLDSIASSGPGQPGSKGVSIGEQTEQKPLSLKGWWLWEIPPQVKPLIDQAVRFAEKVLEKPLRVLRGRGAPTARGFASGEPVAFQIGLKNIGIEPLVADNPLSAANPKFLGMKLVVSRIRAKSEEGDTTWIDLTPVDVHPSVKGAARGKRMKLAAGEELTFRVKRKLLAGTGRYRAYLLYECSAGPDEWKDVLYGTLKIELGEFEILTAGAKAH